MYVHMNIMQFPLEQHTEAMIDDNNTHLIIKHGEHIRGILCLITVYMLLWKKREQPWKLFPTFLNAT